MNTYQTRHREVDGFLAVLRWWDCAHPRHRRSGRSEFVSLAASTDGLLQAVKAQVDAAAAAGTSLDDALARIKVDDLRAGFVGDDPDRALFFDPGFLATAIRRAYREAKSGLLQDQE